MAYKWRNYGVYRCEKGSTFAAKLKVRKMNPISITGTIAAALNYKRAKEEYESLVEREKELQDSYMQTQINSEDDSIYYVTADDLNKTAKPMPGVTITPMVRVANISGNRFQSKISLFIKNSSENDYYIGRVSCSCWGWDYRLSNGEKDVDAYLKANSELVIDFDRNIIKGARELNDIMRSVLLETTQKSILSAVPKTTIYSLVSSTLFIMWIKPDGSESVNYEIPLIPTAFRYCGVGSLN